MHGKKRRYITIDLFLNYIKTAARKIKRQKGYSIINISGLAVGLACCAIIMLWISNEKSFDRFHANRDSIYRLIKETQNNSKTTLDTRTPYPLAEAILEKIPEVESFTRYQAVDKWKISYGDKFYFNDWLGTADPNFFDIFSFPFVKGDPKTALTGKNSIVLTESMARKYFGAEEPLGKVLTMFQGRFVFTVSAVIKDVPRNSHLHFDCLIPIVNFWEWWDGPQSGWDMIMFYTYIKQSPNSSHADVAPKISALLNENVKETKAEIHLQPLSDVHLKSNFEWDLDNWEQGSQSTLTLFTLAAFGVLLLAMINFTNLATARSASRAKEVGIRKINGARRYEIIGQFLGEAVIMSILAMLLAIILVYFALPAFNRLAGKQIAFADLFEPQLCIILLSIAILTGVMSGSYPAFFLSSFQPSRVLKGEIHAKGHHQSFLRRTLVVVQFGLTFFLIIASVIIGQQMKFIKGKDLGINTHNVVNFEGVFSDGQSAKNVFLNDPRILSITQSDPPRLDQRGRSDVTWEGKNPENTVQFIPINVDPDYLTTMGTSMTEGRFFMDDYPTDRTEALVLNQSAVRAMGIDSPVGKRITVGEDIYTIIGIIKDFHITSLHRPIEPMIFLAPKNNWQVCARISPVDTKGTIAFIEETMKEYMPDNYFRGELLDDQIDKFYTSEKKVETILSIFTIIALFTACLGLLGLASYLAEKRTKEVGLRKIFGAPVPGLIWMQTLEFSKWIILAGLITGPLAYYAGNEWLKGFAYHYTPGIGILIVTLLVTLIMAAITVGYQSIRAALANPVDSLMHE